MKYLNYSDIAMSLKKWEKEKFLIGGTSVRPNNMLQKIVSSIKPEIKNIVEIGTGFGTSAVAIAGCGNVKKLITLDIKKSIWPEYIIHKFNLENKIEFIVAKDSQEIYEIIKKYKFDFAYIDGAHIPPFPENDFNAVKHIGRVLFDDIYSNNIMMVLEKNNGRKLSVRFGYWNAKGNYEIIKDLGTITDDDKIDKKGKLVCNYDYLNKI